MNHTQMTARVGLFFIIGVTLIWVTFDALHDGRFSAKNGYNVTAAFSTLKELKAGDSVRMAGVQIGTVEKTRLANGRAEAVLKITSTAKIATDSVATISMAGLLGANYIALDLGHPGQGVVAAGGELRTKDAADINQIVADLGSLGQDLKGAIGQIGKALGGGSDGKGGLFQKLDGLVTENSAKISNTLTNVEDITAKIRSGQGTLGKLVNEPSAYNELLAAVAEIKSAAAEAKALLANTQEIIAQVKSGKGSLGTLIYDDQAAGEIRAVVKNLRDVSDKLNNPNSSFGQLITSDTLVKDAQSTLRKVDRAVEGMGDSGPITAVGVVANALF